MALLYPLPNAILERRYTAMHPRKHCHVQDKDSSPLFLMMITLVKKMLSFFHFQFTF